MKTLIVAMLLLVTPALTSAKRPIKKLHRGHRVVVKTTGITNARAHGGNAYAKGHRVHSNRGNGKAKVAHYGY